MKFDKYKKLSYCQFGLLFVVLVVSAFVWADDIEKRFSVLPKNMDYSFEFWKKWEKRSTDVPERVRKLIMQYYAIPEKLKHKLELQIFLLFKDNYLIQISIKDAKNKSKFPQEFSIRKKIATKTCDVVSQQFESYCSTLHNILELRPKVLVDVKNKKVIPVPSSVKAKHVVEPVINTENFDWVAKKNISRYKNLYISLGEPVSPGLFDDMKFSFEGAAKSHQCFAGGYGISDINGDGVSDLVVLGGRVDDSIFDWQIETKTYAYARVYILAIDFSQGVAIPLFQDELFAYEMDYKGQSEGIGEGVIKEARFYWGDFNKDGKYDYLIRRKQTAINIDFGRTAKPQWSKNGLVTEKVNIFEGDTNGYKKVSGSNEKFLKYVQNNTGWSQGFS